MANENAYDIYGNAASYSGLGDIMVSTPVDDVSLSKTMLSFTGLNLSKTLTATVSPSTATDKDSNVEIKQYRHCNRHQR